MKRFGIAVLLATCLATTTHGASFVRGDVDQNGILTITDVIGIVTYLFADRSYDCIDALDVDDGGTVNIADPLRLAVYLFRGGPGPELPFPECSVDPTDDELSCDAFNAELCPDEPPVCLSAEELSEEFTFVIDQSLCLPSPLLEFELLPGSVITVCPEGSMCSDEQSGCEVVFNDATASVDLIAGQIATIVTLTADLPMQTGDIVCDTVITLEGTLSIDIVLEPTAWEGISEITEAGNLAFTITDISVDASGGLVCGLLELSGDLLAGLIESQIDALTGDLFGEVGLDLGGIHVCSP